MYTSLSSLFCDCFAIEGSKEFLLLNLCRKVYDNYWFILLGCIFFKSSKGMDGFVASLEYTSSQRRHWQLLIIRRFK